MIFQETKLPGVFQIDIEPMRDERGFFARSWCQREFEGKGLVGKLVQCSVSYNARAGTLRGMHYQQEPFQETKLVRCTKGMVYDVVLDLRRQSATFKEWIGINLTSSNRRMLYVPEGCAHGFLTLEEGTEVCYQMSTFYHPESTAGVRWDDPSFRIHWPQTVEIISQRDRTFADFK